MPSTCVVTGCKSNYLSVIKVEGSTSVYHFPENKTERDRWISAKPQDDLVSKFPDYDLVEFETVDGKQRKKRKKKPNLVVCRKHWPDETLMIECQGKNRPINPPSVFKQENSSSTPSLLQPTNFRSTKRSLSSVRNVSPDQLGSFLDQDLINFDEIVGRHNGGDLLAFSIDENEICIQPRVFAPIPLFLLQIQRDLQSIPSRFCLYDNNSLEK